ncbi:RAD50-interacting protein 1 [Ischnura elegans]|uniref:RAD50-interacting protein 1 n=1 Tax=Ischnura elegans TaxID=197161 RepID=UPI001ED86F44|nr:RAD50-interacting protein 1 [Ischnura elegans]
MALIEDVINKINAELRGSSCGIGHCIEMEEKLKNRKASIENAMSLVSTEFPSKVSEVVQEVNNVTIDINALASSFENLRSDIKDHLSKSESTTEKLGDYINDIDKLEKCISYLSWVKAIEDTCVEMEASYLEKDEESCLVGFKRLSNYQKCLQTTSCQHLLSYINDTIHFWHTLLEETFSKEFEEVLKILKWPFVGGNISLESPPVESLHRFQKLAELLLQLQIPEKLGGVSPVVSSVLLTEFALPPLPIRLLLRPLAKRFAYHFRGPRKTNRLDRPEWYLTQILTWIRDHSHFLTQWLQPALDQMEEDIDANVEFMRGLVRILAEKVQSDLANLLQTHPTDSEPSAATLSPPTPTSSPSKPPPLGATANPPPPPSSSSPSMAGNATPTGCLGECEELFSHLIDEVLSFEKELRDLDYPDSQPGLLSVITQANVFVWWIHVEKKNAGEKMDQILFSETAWQPLGSKEFDDMKVTECGDSFLSLLMTITDRYKNLPQPGHRLQFLDLQLFLLEDFRMRVLQQLHTAREDPFGLSLSAILNTLAYISHVLQDWSDTPHFLQLQFYMMQFDKLQSFHEKRTQVNVNDKFLGSREPNEGHEDTSQKNDLGKEAEDLGWTVFDQTLALFSHLQSDLLGCICDAIMADVKDKSRLYRSDKWFAMPSPKEFLNPCLSPSACPMFEVLSEHLHWLKDTLSIHLLSQAWQILCSDLNKFLYQKLILVNNFNEGGALQLQFDMTRNLFPLFSQFTEKPENHFKEIKEVCFLLTISKGSALLLREALDFPNRQGSSSEEDEEGTAKQKDGTSLRGPARVLAEMGVHKLTPSEAKVILDLRTDLLSIQHGTVDSRKK